MYFAGRPIVVYDFSCVPVEQIRTRACSICVRVHVSEPVHVLVNRRAPVHGVYLSADMGIRVRLFVCVHLWQPLFVCVFAARCGCCYVVHLNMFPA